MTSLISGLFTPLLAAGLAVLGSGFKGRGWDSKYTWTNAGQLGLSTYVAEVAVDALAGWNAAGFFGAHRLLTDALATGVIYGGIRKQFESESFWESAGYGAGVEFLADVLTPSVGSATGILVPGASQAYSQGAALTASIIPPAQRFAWQSSAPQILNSY